MPLMQLVITLVVVGILLWLVNRFIPMQSSIKSILNGVVVICVVLMDCESVRPFRFTSQHSRRPMTQE